MTTTQRVTDLVEVRSDIDELDKVTDLHRLHERKQEDLRALGMRLGQLRQEFVTALQELGF